MRRLREVGTSYLPKLEVEYVLLGPGGTGVGVSKGHEKGPWPPNISGTFPFFQGIKLGTVSRFPFPVGWR